MADNRTIKFNPIEPILQEDNGVAVWRFRIPKMLNNIDMSGFAWWFVYINAAKQKYSEPLTLTADADDPDNYCIADYTIDYGISLTPGSFTFALEAINANGGGEIIEEWHTKTYSHSVIQTLQGNQAEYSETESDIISALIVQIQQKYNALVGGATPIPVASVSQMTDTAKVYLNTTDKNWYYYNSDSSTWVSGGQYASGIVIDPTLTQSGQAADAKVTGDKIDELKADLTTLNDYTYDPSVEPFHIVTNESTLMTAKPGYYAGSTGWNQHDSYNAYYFNAPKGTKIYFYREGVTNQFFVSIYKPNYITSNGFIVRYNTVPTTEENAIVLEQDSTIVISLTATQDIPAKWYMYCSYYIFGDKVNLHVLNQRTSGKLNGKTIYCFGDSLTGMFESPTDYPTYMSQLTGANCVNVGFSGTRMSTYQDLYVGMSMYNLANSIASGNWTVQQDTIDQNSKTEWQAKKDLLASTNWNNVDGITIFFGTNDYGNGAYVNDEEGATESKSVGLSLGHILDTILTAYPHLQILVVTPIWRAYSNVTGSTQDSDVSPNTRGAYLIDYVDAEIEVARKHHIPVIDMYRTSQFSAKTSSLLLSDGTHPTLLGRKRIGNMIGEKIMQVFM